MKVFAPERVIYIGSYSNKDAGSSRSYGIPLGGAWIDVDDYFHQVSSGGAINDVIHAKVVASTGVPYTCGDLVDEKGNIYPCSGYGRDTWFRDTIAVFVSHEVEETYIPNYKGKKPIQPRRRKYTVRDTLGACAYISVSTNYGRPYVNCQIYVHVPKIDDEAKNRYGYKRLDLTAKWGSGKKSRCGGSANPLLYPILDMVIGYLESTFGEHGENYHGPMDRSLQESIHAAVMSAISGNLYSVCDYVARTTTTGSKSYGYLVTSCTTDKVEGLRACFMLHEPETMVERIDPLVLRGNKDFANYWRNYLTQHALLGALESFPRLSDNSISNALEVLGFIKTLVVDHRIEIPKSLNDLWLSYRYSYNTTKLDIEEAVKFVRRHTALGTLDRAISCYGISHHTFENGTTVTCRCECNVIPQIVNTANRLLRTLDQYGLSPNFYIVWDMIPYSFMVDWFVPIGDMLAVEDVNSRFLSGEFYKIRDVCYSLSYTREFQNARVKCYSRWRGSVPTSLNSFYWLEPPSSSSKTTVFRVLDAASIFIGR